MQKFTIVNCDVYDAGLDFVFSATMANRLDSSKTIHFIQLDNGNGKNQSGISDMMRAVDSNILHIENMQ